MVYDKWLVFCESSIVVFLCIYNSIHPREMSISLLKQNIWLIISPIVQGVKKSIDCSKHTAKIISIIISESFFVVGLVYIYLVFAKNLCKISFQFLIPNVIFIFIFYFIFLFYLFIYFIFFNFFFNFNFYLFNYLFIYLFIWQMLHYKKHLLEWKHIKIFSLVYLLRPFIYDL